jgi:hypothetical protein
MITTRTSWTDKIDLMQTLSSFLSKACTSGQETRTAPENQFLWTRIARSVCRLAIALILLSPLVAGNSSYAAGRVFYDGFENGISLSNWNVVGTYPVATTVRAARDGGTPRSGSWMAETNWGSSTGPYSSLNKKGWPWTKEMFIRFWFRYDNDVDNGFGSKMFRLGSDYPTASMYLACQMESPPASPMFYFWETVNGSNGPLSYGNSTGCGDRVWHKLEIYIKANTSGQADGIFRIWKDGAVYQTDTNITTVTAGHFWNEIGFVSNWSNFSNDANNHVYWDDFEIYSDSNTGTIATGLMSDATISSNDSGSSTAPNPPSNAQVTPQ